MNYTWTTTEAGTLCLIIDGIGAYTFGAWMESFYAGVFMFIVLSWVSEVWFQFKRLRGEIKG